MSQRKARQTAFGQEQPMTWVDRLGIRWSERQVQRQLQRARLQPKTVLDLGCGYHARLMRMLAPNITEGICVDMAVSPEVQAVPGLKRMEKPIEQTLKSLKSNHFDLILMISVLEHLAQPNEILEQCWRLLKPGGMLLINVPTWQGKKFLEFSAFTLQLSPASEMDDHKMYYEKRDLWPLLVAAGFLPSKISLHYHKFGLNLYAVCRKEAVS